VAEAERAGQDVVVASRHVPGGSDGGLAGWRRRAASRAATGLARAACPRALRGISDPMSGFFAVRREALALEALKPQGFKILVEILARHPHLRRGEVPFVFAERHAGQSKAGAAEGWRFLRLLMHLRVRGGWHSRMIQFGLVGLAGLAVNTVALWLFATPMWGGLPYLVAAVLATQVSSAWNFFGYETWVYPGAKRSRWWSRLLRTTAVNDAALIFRLPLMALLVEIVGIGYLVANALTLFLLFVSRFLVSDRLIYNQG
jgi:dolichol-phosphate mannosyltransferase